MGGSTLWTVLGILLAIFLLVALVKMGLMKHPASGGMEQASRARQTRPATTEGDAP